MYYLKWTAGLLAAMLLWLAISVYGGLSGWWLSAIAPAGDTAAFTRALGEKLHAEKRGNTALVLIENGEVVAQDFSASVDTIDQDTLFPLASASKLLAAYGVLSLVESGALALDAPVSQYLTRWQLPDSEFDNNKVTVRRLLSHTAGLTDGLGFDDYKADESVPTLEESLANPRASRGEKTIEVGLEPGSEWKYSGGSYLLLELLVEETSGMSFERWMQQAVFDPLGMRRATYAYLADQDSISYSYDTSGQRAPLYRYASAAATGLSASTDDLVKFATALARPGSAPQPALGAASVDLLRQPLGYQLGAAIWGPGAMLYAPTGDDFVFGHDGSNEPAINSALRVNPANGDAIVVLSTGRAFLASSLAYEWTLWQTGYPDFFAFDTALSSAVTPALFGLAVILVVFVALLVRRRRRVHN
ncbi:class A beta-lactamase-related serine hydrolase [Mangrovimicrobium sediminis]|uniref:Class A beta-lactamase-related serine hydrolase n=1 Tax=Mangrovimicrobium sediminis TaxID=2562682 RepID=A0A4Z0M9T5_9GAMM|nr:serine hydrolase domain-containing protein [Haliea sp. SAOS-164]TGD76244.1 class A beta-lactamase-related serine hydrolase [Haliea sp. SAOS-164]